MDNDVRLSNTPEGRDVIWLLWRYLWVHHYKLTGVQSLYLHLKFRISKFHPSHNVDMLMVLDPYCITYIVAYFGGTQVKILYIICNCADVCTFTHANTHMHMCTSSLPDLIWNDAAQ